MVARTLRTRALVHYVAGKPPRAQSAWSIKFGWNLIKLAYAIPTSEAWYCNARCCAMKKWVPQHRKPFQILNLKKFRVSDNVGRWNDVFPKILIENRPEKCTFQRFPTIVMKFLVAHTRCPAYQTVAKTSNCTYGQSRITFLQKRLMRPCIRTHANSRPQCLCHFRRAVLVTLRAAQWSDVWACLSTCPLG